MGGSLLRQNIGPFFLFSPEVDDFSWEPPTEAETKVLQARRERQDRISRLMGDYLLRGYRMLGETCAECGVRTQASGWGWVVGQAAQAFSVLPSEPFTLRLIHALCRSDPQTILLQDKQRKIYCVACQELDSDVDKDNPGEGLSLPTGRGVWSNE